MIDVASTSRRELGNEPQGWQSVVARYQRAHVGRATWQLVNSFGSYIALWWLMHLCLSVSWWLTLPLAVLAGGVLIRVFIIFHDCGHGSFFASRWANSLVGSAAGLLAFAPFRHWRWQHAVHHATSGDLDRRGVGDIWTLTVQEYLQASRWKKLAYRLSRNPIVLFLLAPLFLVLVMHRIPSSKARARERWEVWGMNGLLLCFAAGMCALFGFVPYVVLQTIVITVAGAAGVWLFYVQHQFDDTYWERAEHWDYSAAALRGSSFYQLPRVLQWFSGNIGFHHVHHLSPRIPNYNLERCHRSEPMFECVRPVTMRSSLRSLRFHLWDEANKRLISFGRLRHLRAERARAKGSREIA